MDLQSLTYDTTLIVNASLLLLIFFRSPRRKADYLFMGVIGGLIFWIGTLYLYYRSQDPTTVLWFGRLNFAFAALIAPLLLEFVFYFPSKLKHQIPKWVHWAIFVLTGVLFLLSAFTPMVGEQELIEGASRGTIFGPLYPVYVATFLFFVAMGIILLVLRYRDAQGSDKLQLKYLTLGVIFSVIFGTSTNIFIPAITGNTDVQNLGPLATLILAVFITYTIIQHRLMDIRLAARALLFRLFEIGILSTIFYLVARIFMNQTVSTTHDNIVILVISASTAIILLYQLFDKLIRTATDQFFFQREYNRRELLNRLGKLIAESIDLRELEEGIEKILQKVMKVKSVRFVVDDTGKTDNFLLKHVTVNPKLLVSDEIARKLPQIENQTTKQLQQKILETMREQEIVVVAPLIATEGVVGMFLLGDKKSGDAFTSHDIETLESLMYQAGVAIENAALYNQAQQFNEKLQREVKKATANLEKRNVQLRKAYADLKQLDRMKDELVTVTSHELRTPMTSIKSYLWMALDRGRDRLDDDLKKYIQRAFNSSERMIDLVEETLSVSKLEGGKIELEKEPVQLGKLIDDLMGDFKPQAKERGLQLKVEAPDNLPEVEADPDRLREIITNLVGNALKFVQEGGVSVKVEKNDCISPQQSTPNLQQPYLWISVIDTGPGISKENQKRLFEKFGRVGVGDYHVAAETQGGTGLGLYITKGLVELHGGKIWVESQEGEDSTFTFSLPVDSQDATSPKPEGKGGGKPDVYHKPPED